MTNPPGTDPHPATHRSHFLLVGDSADVPFLRRLLERLPVDAYGQMFIETAWPAETTALDAPDGIAVTWLSGAERETWLRGEAAAAATLAWMSEWLPSDIDAGTAPYVLWIGCANSTVVDRLRQHLGDRLDHLHLHHAHSE